jgi:hypothetical protein
MIWSAGEEGGRLFCKEGIKEEATVPERVPE